MAELFRYAAFISYSSKDARFAHRLHRALEHYAIPTSLGKFDLINGGKKNRIYPVFRDREELSAGQLGEQIEANLRASAALIVVCSPNSAASPWVQKEIEYFAGLGRHAKIFAIIPDGAPLTDDAGVDATQSCFPAAFLGNALAGDKLEPLAADARKSRDGFRNAWLKLVAGMIGVTPGQIIDRDRKRRTQQRLQLTLASLLAVVALGVTGGLIYSAQMQARSLQLAELARRAAEDGNYDRAARYAAAGLAGANWPLLGFNAGAAEAELRRAVSGPLITAFRAGDGEQFNTAVFSADGRQIITAAWNASAGRSSVRTWDSVTGAPVGTLELAPNPGYLDGGLHPLVKDMAVSADGARMAIAAPDAGNGGVRIFAEGRQLAELRTSTVFTVDISPDGSMVLVTRLMDDAARIFDATSGRELAALRGHDVNQVSSAVFSHNGHRAITGGADATARIWDVEDGRELARLSGHTDVVQAAVFSPDDAYAFTASDDGTALVWDATTGRALGSIHVGTIPLTDIAVSSDRIHIAIADSAGVITIYDVRAGAAVRRLVGDGPVQQVRFSPDGSALAAVSDACIRVWSVAAEHALIPVDRGEAPIMIAFAAAGRGDTNATFSRDGALLATASDDRLARVWNIADRREVARLSGHQDIVWGVAFNADGSRVVTTSSDRTARIWDVASGRQLVALQHADGVTSAAFSPDGQRVVTTAGEDDARVWDASSGRQLLTLPGERSVGASFSPDGARILTEGGVGGSAAALWDANTASRIAEFEEGRRAAFSPDGSMFVTTGHAVASVWDTATVQQIVSLSHPDQNVWDAAFSHDGHRIVTASEDGVARIWSVPEGRELAVLRHADLLLSARFSPDDTRVVTTSFDGATRVWDLATQRQVQIIGGLYGVVRRAEFSADGERVATAAMDLTSLVTDVFWTSASRGELIHLACIMGPLNNGNDRFTGDELERTPVLDPTADRQACHPPGLWARFGHAIGQLERGLRLR